VNCKKKSRGWEDTETRNTDCLPPKQSACNRALPRQRRQLGTLQAHSTTQQIVKLMWRRCQRLIVQAQGRAGAGSRRRRRRVAQTCCHIKIFCHSRRWRSVTAAVGNVIGQWRVCDMHIVPFSAILEEPLRCQLWKCDSGQSASSRKHWLDGATCPLDIPEP